MLGASPSLPHFGIWRHWSLCWLDHLRFETGHAGTRAGAPGLVRVGSRSRDGSLPVGRAPAPGPLLLKSCKHIQ